jgi:vitamin B12 transporter
MGDTVKLRLAFLAALAAAPGFAQEPSPELDPIVVTATRSDRTLSRTLAPVIVITRDEIERAQAFDLAELLRFHAGLDVARNGGAGQATSVFIRGAESNHTLVLVDGVRINPGTIGGAAFQNLSPDMIERIEVVKGPRSSQWGSDAIGGVINIITRRPGGALGGEARVTGGSDDTWNGALGVAHRGERLEASLNVDQFATRGFPAQDAATEDTGHDRLSVNAGAAVAAGPARIAARHWQADGRTDYLDFFGTRVDQDFHNSSTQLETTAPAGPLTLRAAVTHATDEVRQNQSADYALTRRTGLELQGDWAGPAATLTLGAQGYREEADSVVFGSGFDVRTDVGAAFLQGTADADRHHGVAAVRYTDHEAFGGHVTGDVEYGVDAWRGARLVAAAGTAFRAPDATDRFGFGGDPDLEPEESRNLELGLRQQLGAAHTLSVAAFDNRIDQLIEFVCLDAFCFTGENRNVARARIRGVEAGWRWRPGLWSATVEGIVQDPVDETSGERLARRAGKSLTASVSRRVGAVDLGTDLLAQGRREDSAFSASVNAGYAVWNATAGWRAWRGLTLQARGENLLDRDYATATGFRSPGRAGYLTLRYALR